MSTKQVGDESETAVLAELVERGYSVSIPFGDNDPYDLVVDAEPELYRVQVKTGWLEDGRVRFKTCSRTTEGGDPATHDYTATEGDAFAVRCRELGTLYWVPIEVTGAKNSYLRVEPPDIEHPSAIMLPSSGSMRTCPEGRGQHGDHRQRCLTTGAEL